MQLRITQLTEAEIPAVRSFNARMAAVAPFLIPERVFSPSTSAVPPAISWSHYVALEGSDVRGGFLLMDQPAFVRGQVQRVINSQSMLSEGIRDRKYALVSVQMLKYLERTYKHVFMVGMGSMQEPLPRLLVGAGWNVRPVPFLFLIRKVRAFLREMRVFGNGRGRRVAVRLADVTGVGWLGAKLIQSHPFVPEEELRGLTLVPLRQWGPWTDEIWSKYRIHCSFGVERDQATLNSLYPLESTREKAAVVNRDGVPMGWVAWLSTRMQNDKYFGNLHVVTILDCVAAPDDANAMIHFLADSLETTADLVISNQTHALWVNAFRRAGFHTAPSNYLLATSKNLTAAILAGGGEDRAHLTRGDGDGRIHL